MCPFFESTEGECAVANCDVECFGCISTKMCQSRIYEVCTLYIMALFRDISVWSLGKSDC